MRNYQLKSTKLALLVTASLTFGSVAHAAEKPMCQTVRFANPGWSDLQVSIGWAKHLLNALGYQTTETNVSTTVTFASLANQDLDVMLFDWNPANEELHKRYKGKYDVLGRSLPKVRYTLATTPKAAAAGLKTWQDIAKFEKELKGKIYGIEPGSGGNTIVSKFMQETGLDKNFKLVESSTNAMLAEVQRNKDGFIVYLAWEPHWMVKYDPQYLDGGDKWMGKDFGSGYVDTLGRMGFKKDCRNLAKFFKNYVLDVKEESNLIDKIDVQKQPADKVTLEWLKSNPDVVKKWLRGVKTFDGQDGWKAVAQTLNF